MFLTAALGSYPEERGNKKSWCFAAGGAVILKKDRRYCCLLAFSHIVWIHPVFSRLSEI